ncbi:MAG TPA: sigma-70 family RNA polymerase sigma factor, partial [Phycisphaerae bacterium]|nr:sigma-70 family RNA polymerase sigma factor [Phycisphaerae bacterium]
MPRDSQVLAELLNKCRTGDRRAWDLLVETYWQRLFGYALRATNNQEIARDLVQETFLRIVQNLDRYDDQGKFEAWMFRILVNLVRDNSRMMTRRPIRSTVINHQGGGELTDELPGKLRAPADSYEHAENVDRLLNAIERLPDMDRQVLMLRHYADMPFKEIAKVLNCPLGTVLARTH